jgi:hypothetical protein
MVIPPGPLPIRAELVEAAATSAARRRWAGLLTLGAGIAAAAGLAMQLVHEARVWQRGSLAAYAEAEVRASPRVAGLRHIELGVRYRASEGQRGGPDGVVAYLTLGAAPDATAPPVVRWSGSELVTSWQIDAAPSRWAAIAVLSLLVSLLAAPWFLAARGPARTLARLRRVLAADDRIELPIVASGRAWFSDLMPRSLPFRWISYRVNVPILDGAVATAGYRDPARVVSWRARRFTFRGGAHAPLLLHTPDRLLALRDPEDPDRLTFVRADGWPAR